MPALRDMEHSARVALSPSNSAMTRRTRRSRRGGSYAARRSSPGFEGDEEELRVLAETSFDRGANAAGSGRQLAAIQSGGSHVRDLRRIKAPTLVIHGKADLLVRPSGGRATARAIPNARLHLIDGMGHDLPRGAWPEIIDGIVQNAAAGSTLVAA